MSPPVPPRSISRSPPWGQLTGTVVSVLDGCRCPAVAVPERPRRPAHDRVISATAADRRDGPSRSNACKPAGQADGVRGDGQMTPLATTPYTVTAGSASTSARSRSCRRARASRHVRPGGRATTTRLGRVTSIKPGGAGRAAGIVVGDKIITIDGQRRHAAGRRSMRCRSCRRARSGSASSVQLGLARGGSGGTLTSVKW